ncbi:MAG TPA: aldo/keto reductase [Caulobacteraceae bacterium]|jgi:aryl-alcohol dehydrogenase-like predicted oxidoreductase
MLAPADLPRVVFGCGNFGGMGSAPALRAHGDGREQAFALLDHARDLGLTRFDTANTYGGGASERFLGDWLARQDPGFRARAEVATKVGNPYGAPPGERPLSSGEVARHVDESLRRLRLERIGLYYLHEFDPLTPLEETLAALERALAAGKIAAFGVSNASLADLQAVLRLAATGPLRAAFTHVQNEFSLVFQRDLAEVIPLCVREGLGYVAFSPLAGGLLTGKYKAGEAAVAGTRLASAADHYAHLATPQTFAAVEALQRRAADRGWTTPGAALRFVLETPGVDSLIVAPRTIAQFDGYGWG